MQTNKPRTGGHETQGMGRPRGRRRHLCPVWLIAAGMAVSLSAAAHAQTVMQPAGDHRPQPPMVMAPPPTAPSVLRLLSADYLTEDERKDARIFHGLWKPADLDTAERIARVALMTGALDDASFTAADISAQTRAEGALLRGEPQTALTLLAPQQGADDAGAIRAMRIRCAALESLGRFDEAAVVAADAARRLASLKAPSAEQITEGVRALAILARLRGPSRAGERPDYHAMLSMLDDVVNKVDRLYWPARLAQAELLYEKDNGPEAADAVKEVLKLNPACARAWALQGKMTVDSYNFSATEQVAARLDILARGGADQPDAPEAGAGAEVAGVDHVSPYSGLLRARAFLRLNDPDNAAAALGPIIDRYPHQREALAVRCAVEAVRYQPERLAPLLGEFDSLSPGSPQALFEVGRALSEARQYEMAAGYLEKAQDRLSTWAEPMIELGLLEVQSGRDERALAALEKAAALDPFNIRTANSLKLVKELATYNRVESEHYTVRYKPGEDEVLAREMLGPLESNYRAVTGKGPGGIDFEPTRKTVIDLMPDHVWFGVRITGMGQIHTIAASTGPCIAMEVPKEGRGHQGPYDWVRVLRHEFTHTVTLERTKNRIPHWFTEAAAVYLELSPRDYQTCQLLSGALSSGSLFNLEEINTAFVRPKKPTDRQQAYAQGHWMYEFILGEWGARAPLDLMDHYAKGQREEAAFQSVLGVSREQFLERFKVWAKGQVVSWGMSLKEGEPDIPQLLLESVTSDPEKKDEIASHLEQGARDAGLAIAGVGAGDAADWSLELGPPTQKMVAQWLEAHPDHPDVLELAVQLALAGTDKKATSEIAPLLERYAAARPVDPLPHQLLATLYLGTSGAEAQKAIEHLEYLDAREQRTPAYCIELAKRYAAAGDWDKAGVKAERATQLDPFDAAVRELAASVAIKRNDFKAAERHLSALVAIEPGVPKHKQRLEALKKLEPGRPAGDSAGPPHP